MKIDNDQKLVSSDFFVYLLFLFFEFNMHKVQICKIRSRLDMPSAHVLGCSVLFRALYCFQIKVITKLPNSEQSYKGKVKTHNYINRQNQSTTGKL